uniref:Glycosyltransferase family 92 protein n=1 Tax=Meloidogyne enterolobii TaxID=390850 RepID=A0A6V7V0H1_MELEN|nr:unnamed protein product [Meloidogyne enterolobii]
MQRADNKPKKFIACPSRLFAFDQWHLFITTMELYRLHRVDLVIVYIQSVEAQVYNLIKVYEKSGLVQIRPSLEMPSTNTELDYNPNSETSWQNQLTNFQDCLYEFKESAEFIAFPDWDDFFFTSNYNIPYYPILQKFAEQNPKVNTFIIDRYMGYHESLDEMYINGHWMTDFWRQGIKYSTKDKQFFAGKKYGKAIYKPNRGIYGVDLHWANRVENGYTEIRIPLNKAYIIHARDYSKYKLDGRIENTRPLELNFTAFVRRYKLSSLLNKLPKSEALTVELNKCLGFNSQGMKVLVDKSESKCWNYHKCNIKKLGQIVLMLKILGLNYVKIIF